ncbi:MAG TPA: ChbG/HpnK family deacetylase [Candidatus Bathyarchaeia archaeon]|nr:ChbG/HpnK family deacetylase [Candidatus Bathyarchaeia archaeon]
MFHEKSQPKADPPRAEKNLIIAADDFGKSELANQNILRLAKAGKLDRISVMSDGHFSPEEAEELKNFGAKLDIHFELDWQKKRRHLLNDSVLRQGMVFLGNYFRPGYEKKVREDWDLQIKKFHALFGRYPDGMNSHEHAHFFPAYFKIAVDLARKYGISYVRFGVRGFEGRSAVKRRILNILRWRDKDCFFESGLGSSDFFASIDWIDATGKNIRFSSKHTIEISCHPEREDEFESIKKYF